MIDPILTSGSGSSLRDIDNSIHIGLLCVQEKNIDRPTMADVVQMLNSFPITPPMPSKPAFFMAEDIQMHDRPPVTPPTPSNPATPLLVRGTLTSSRSSVIDDIEYG